MNDVKYNKIRVEDSRVESHYAEIARLMRDILARINGVMMIKEQKNRDLTTCIG